MLLEGVFVDVQPQLLVEILKEDTAHIVALADDDGILLRELLQVGKRRSEHRVRRDIAHACALVELLHIRLHGGDIADDTLLGQIRNDLLKYRDGVFQRDAIDQQFRLKLLDLIVGGETLTVIGEAHSFGISLKNCHLVVETQQVDEETTHLSCAHD